MSGFLALLRREPVRVLTVLGAIFGIATAFGLPISPTQTAAVVGLVAALIGGGEVARAQVIPTEKLGDAWEPPLP